jgi:uncharacterized membrane protein YecN with MAPEG domain
MFNRKLCSIIFKTQDMLKLWNDISFLGQKTNNSETLNARIGLSNRINVMASAVYLIIGFIYLAFNDSFTALFIGFLFVLNMIAFGYQKRGKYTFSLSLVFIASYLSIFYFDSYAGQNSGAFLYYIPIIMSLLVLFDMKTDRTFLIIHIGFILILFFTNILTGHSLFKSDIMTANMRSVLLYVNIVLNLVSVFYFLYLFKSRRR